VAIFGASFQIGRSALAAYQAAISITGQNIANIGNPDYARQSGRLAAMHGGMTLGGVAPGTGVQIGQLQRHVDEAIENRLRLALGAREGAHVIYTNLSRVESLYNELTEEDLSTQLQEFFGSFAALQTDPVEPTARGLILARTDAVIHTLQRQRNGLLDLVTDLNNAAEEMARTANGLSDEIARLNELIIMQEAGANSGAGALRDRRDALLRDLGELMDIQVRHHENGVVNVYIGSEPLVDFTRSRGLQTVTVLEDGIERTEVRFADNNGTVIMREGQLAATVQARDLFVQGQLDQLDQLAQGLIYEVNRVHSTGRGLVAYTSMTGSYGADDADSALNSTTANLDFPVRNGTLLVRVHDQSTGKTSTQMIEIDLDGLNNDDTTLNDFVAALNGVSALSASLTFDNRVQISAADGFEFSFTEDSSGALAALGLGTFFEGTNATTLAVRSEILSDNRLIATSLSGEPGDGNNAGRIAALATTASDLLGGVTISDFHESIVHGLAVDVSAADTTYQATDSVYSSLFAQREAVSGVSLDEETINLTKFERSFQGASRFISVVDSLTNEIIGLLG
jgi:flagellar hook-associated protein 1 FlgK